MRYIRIHLFKRGKSYYLRYRQAGKSVMRSLGQCPRPWADKKRQELEDEINNPGRVHQAEDRAWRQAVDDYMAWLKTLQRRDTTRNGYLQGLRDLVNSMPRKPQTVGTVRQRDVLAFFGQSRADHSPDTANRNLRSCRAFFNWCVGQKIITESPCVGITQMPSNRKLGIAKPKLIPPAEIRKVIELGRQLWQDEPTYRNHRNYVFLELLRYTGMRLMEAVYLDWANVKLDDELVEIRPKAGWRIKTDQQREIAIHPKLLKVLRQYQAKWPKGLMYVLHSAGVRDGKISTRRWLHGNLAVVKKLAVQAGVRVEKKVSERTGKKVVTSSLNNHHFRHLFRTLMDEQGASAAAIDYMMGHTEPSTARQYIHPRKAQMKKVIRLLDFGA